MLPGKTWKDLLWLLSVTTLATLPAAGPNRENHGFKNIYIEQKFTHKHFLLQKRTGEKTGVSAAPGGVSE